MMVNFGSASGAPEPLNLALLQQKGSLFVTRPTLNTYAAKREDLVAGANDLFDVVKSGKVKIEIAQRYPLKDAAQAHRDLEARKTTGSTILLP
jgi:NADPH2:quinone reductase